MTAPSAAAIYRQVIDAVISNSRSDFEDDGVDDSLLEELLRGWESRIVRERIPGFEPVSEGLVELGPVAQHHEADVAHEPYDGTDYYGAMMLEHATYDHDPSEYETSYAGESATAASLAALADASHQQYSSKEQGHQYVAGGAAGKTEEDNVAATIPQNDGARNDEGPEGAGPIADLTDFRQDGARQSIPGSSIAKSCRPPLAVPFSPPLSSAERPQDCQTSTAEVLGRPSVRQPGRLMQFDGGDDDGDNSDDINSDLDDSDEDANDAAATDNLEHIILCQYDKVTRSKNKWRCVLKDGIMLINKQEFLFHKATGEFEW